MRRLVQPIVGRLVTPLNMATGQSVSPPPPDPEDGRRLDFSTPSNSQFLALLFREF